MFASKTQPAPGLIPFRFPGLAAVCCAFSTRTAGSVALAGEDAERIAENGKNREAVAAAAGLSAWAELHQVHGDAIVEAAPTPVAGGGELPKADGHYTAACGLGLVVKTADCQPLLFARADGGAVAALHVGWRGNAMDFPATAVAALCGVFSCDPGDLLAVRGPSLGPAEAEFVNFDVEWQERFSPWHDPATRTVDLWRLTVDQLVAAGMRRDRIFGIDMCTKTMSDAFFSHRRHDLGRQASIIWIARQ